MFDIFGEIRNILISIRDTIAQAFKVPVLQTAGGGGADKAISKSLGGVGKVVEGMFKSILGKFAIIASIMGGITEPFEVIADPLALIGEILGMILYPILEPFANELYRMSDYLVKIMAYIEPFYPEIERIIGIVLHLLMDVVYSRIIYIYQVVVAVFTFIVNLVDDIDKFLKGEISFGEFMRRVISHLNDLLADLQEALITYIRNIWNSILRALENFGQDAVDWFKSLPQRIIEGLNEGWDSIGDWWNRIWGK